MGSVVAGARAPRQPNARSTSQSPQEWLPDDDASGRIKVFFT